MFIHPCHNSPPKDCNCFFGIWAPGTNDTCWMNDAFNLYAMEVEEEREKMRKPKNDETNE